MQTEIRITYLRTTKHYDSVFKFYYVGGKMALRNLRSDGVSKVRTSESSDVGIAEIRLSSELPCSVPGRNDKNDESH